MQVIRKIDDLGRIVLPKDIRESLRIKCGDDLEIITEKENVILKKHSKLTKLLDVEKIIIELLKEKLNLSALLTDKDKIITGTAKNMQNEKISDDLLKIINEKKQIEKEELNISSTKKTKNLIITPIIKNGDAIGSLVIMDAKEINEKERIVIETLINFLIKYIE